MNSSVKNDDIDDIESDFATLARLASAESHEDVRLFLARLVRKYRQERPEFAERLNQSLKSTQTRSTGSSLLRRDTAPQTAAALDMVPIDGDTRLSLLRIVDDRQGIARPLLSKALGESIEMIIREHKERDRLTAHGISPTRSVALIGPPGVGKTLSARWIASTLRRPLLVLDLATVMSSYLGKTGNNIRSALDYAKTSNSILLLDEIDAIAKRRGDDSDVGELKRLVTVMLQEVDQWPDTGLLLAATNHPELVDPALWRRFDAELHFDNPSEDATRQAIERFLGNDTSNFAPFLDLLVSTCKGNSLSEVERRVNALRRQRALTEATPENLVVSTLQRDIDRLSRNERLEFAINLAKNGLLNHMQISKITGVARDTIRKHAGPAKRKAKEN